ncbi:MAG: FtsQ-type POTRA domain-containing protein [Candidatus Marinimicrobia bacterium]|nr:FtsQ-type POTRA domain-containing protein [Candidatus Neomarinimicrobiota bacterium]
MKKRSRENFMTYLLPSALIAVFVLLCWGGFVWAGKTDLFKLNKINIYGNQIVPKPELLAIIGDMPDDARLLDINLTKLQTRIEQHPYIAGARLSRRFPHRLHLEVIERKPIAMVNNKQLVLLDKDGIVLPVPQQYEFQIPTLSGFNPDVGLYPIGARVLSVRVKETVELLMKIRRFYPGLYDELSEITLNQDDEFTLILTNNPTLINLGNSALIKRIITLMAFNSALQGKKTLTDFAYLDLRYAKQIIAREWS